MEYQVPQFIEVEGKVVGPLTLKQFIYIAGAGGFCIVFFSYLPIMFALLLSAAMVGFAAALAFYKINNKPLINVLQAGFGYYIGPKLFLWKHEEPRTENKNAAPATTVMSPAKNAPRLTQGKLSELAWSLDIKGQNPESEK